MADLTHAPQRVDYRTDPTQYRHWTLSVEGATARLSLDIAEDGGIRPGYKLKLNSYDLGVDIELHDALNRIRFEHPNVRNVIVTSGKILKDLEAMIRMLTKRGLRASDLVCSPDVADTIINDAAVQKLLDNRRIEIGNVEPELLPDGAAIVARLNVLGRIISVISYDLTYTDDEGNDKLYIPSGKCVLTAPGAGRTAYGAVSQVEQSDGEFHTYAGRRVPKYVSSAEGNSRTLTISSRPLMIPNNKNPFIVADVLTDCAQQKGAEHDPDHQGHLRLL